MADIEIVVPEIVENADECVVVTWLKQVGDAVGKDETVLIIQAAKVSVEIPAPASGKLTAILAEQGQVVAVGQALARLEVGSGAIPAAPAPALPTEAAPGKAAAGGEAPARNELPASPVAKRIARERQVDLALVPAADGKRITEKDVQAYLAAAAPPPPAPATRSAPLSTARATVARRMHASLQSAAQVTLHTEADVTGLEPLRTALKPQAPVSYTDLIVRACSLALRQHEQFNAHFDGNALRLLPQVDIGLAIALEDGLIVAVIRDAGHKSLVELAQERTRLAERARLGQLTPGEVSGAGFTITSLGQYEISFFTPIINLPEVAILGVGQIREQLVIQHGKVAQRALLPLSLTFDHRAVDGAPAAAFLQTIKRTLEAPEHFHS